MVFVAVCCCLVQTVLGQELTLLAQSGVAENKPVPTNQTIEQFLDRMLHESVYDKRIRPFYSSDSRSNFFKIILFEPSFIKKKTGNCKINCDPVSKRKD